jgi:hypothetical protein
MAHGHRISIASRRFRSLTFTVAGHAMHGNVPGAIVAGSASKSIKGLSGIQSSIVIRVSSGFGLCFFALGNSARIA